MLFFSFGLLRREGCRGQKLIGRFFSSAKANNKNTLRKQISPLLKLIHPDFFSQYHESIQNDNMQFLQSLNSLIDNVELLHALCLKRSMCDVTTPLSSSYKLIFHVKSQSSSTNTSDISETRPVNIVFTVPRDLTFRQSISSAVMLKRISTLLHRVGAIFEAVGVANPWALSSLESDGPSGAMLWEKNSRGSRPTSNHGFRKRQAGVSVDDPAIQAIMEEKMVEKSLTGTFSSIFGGGADTTRLMQGDMDRYIRNGNVVTAHLSPLDELHAMKRVRDFFLTYGHLVHFSFGEWSSVLILVDGEQAKNTFRKEVLKKRVLVVVPPKFRSSFLVKYLHQVVPQARLRLPVIDGMKKE